MSAAEGDKTISDAIADGYEGLEDPWREVYAAFMEAWDLRLRPGITACAPLRGQLVARAVPAPDGAGP